ncbi:MAG: MFS transporter [Candidatus Anstonellaceae archaeon]
MKKPKWMDTTVFGAGATSFLSDMSHEAVSAMLPALLALLGAPAYALGIIEGVSDGASSFAKLLSGYFADKIGKRKEIATAGYVATGFFPAILALANSWPVVLLGRVFGWLGRGIRGPPRDAILVSSIQKKDLGKVFGFHRAADTWGAVAGPVLAFFLLGWFALKEVIWLAVLPGIAAAAIFWAFVNDKKRRVLKTGFAFAGFSMPRQFKKFTAAVFAFGMADFSHTMLIAFAIASLSPTFGLEAASAAGIGLYTIRNAVYALACFPVGMLGDKFGRKKVLAAGYAAAILMFLGFAFAPPNIAAYILLFSLAGVVVAVQDTLESAIAGELVPEKERSFGFGILAAANGVGDFVSSFVVGIIWAVAGFSAGFAFSAAVGMLGLALLLKE